MAAVDAGIQNSNDDARIALRELPDGLHFQTAEVPLIVAIKGVVWRDLSAELNAGLDLLNLSSFLQPGDGRASCPRPNGQINERQWEQGSGCPEVRLRGSPQELAEFPRSSTI